MQPRPKGSLPITRFRWQGFRLQFIALIFLPLTGILLVISFGSLKLHQNAMRTLVGERDARAASIAVSAIQAQLNHRSAAVQGLALQVIEVSNPNEILSGADALLSDLDYGLAFFSPQGELLAQTGDESLWANLPTRFHTLRKQAQVQAGTQALFSELMPHPKLNLSMVFIAYAAKGDSPLAVGAFSPTTLASRTLNEGFSPAEDTAVFLVAPDLQIIYQIGALSTSESLSNHPGIAEALHGESGTTYVPVDDSEHVIAFSPVPSTGWALVIEEPWEAVTNPILNTTQLAPLVLVPMLLLALVAIWFGARKIIQPLQALETKAVDLAWGDFSTINEPVGGIEEIQRLQQTLVHLSEKVQQAQAGLHDYIGAITTGQEDERHRLARELHDETVQALIALNQRVQLAQLKLGADPHASAALEEIQNLTGQTIQDLRRLIKDLRPLYLEDLGLVATLKMLAQEMSKCSAVPIQFLEKGMEMRFSSEIELAIYRIAQEGLNNIQRHANASEASLMIVFATHQVRLTITDNGHGFDVPESPAEFAAHGHFGLLGIQERAELIGARVEIQSRSHEGTVLNLTLPI